MKWVIVILVAILGVILLLAFGSALQDTMINLTQNLAEPFRTIFRLPFNFSDSVFKILVPFLR